MRILLSCLVLCSLSSWAYADRDAQIVEACKALNQYGASGAAAYQKQRYAEAVQHFQEQAAWTHFCALNEDITGKPVSAAALATAYNNVGLSYAKLNRPQWARAWYQLAPDAAKSRFNLAQLPKGKVSADKQGTYVRYAGQGAWNTFEVSAQQNHYQIDFSGLRMGKYAMIYGPNTGEFSINMPKQAQQAQYRYESCMVNIDFQHDQTQAFLEVSQTEADAECGFGAGVFAEGKYVKVESMP